MKVTYNWLKDFVDIKVSPKVLAEKLTMAGLEVTSLEQKDRDFVFEVEVTANRPDCLSVLGIAQEVAAITKSKFTPHLRVGNIRQKLKKDSPYVSMGRKMKKDFITIQNKKDCAFYRGCLIVDVKVGPSPLWLRNRIEAVGIRPVNNIVDITNYCLMEYGQPLHAFDYNKIVEKIIVRRAKRGEKILTIDGVERELSENILVISDRNKAIAIAGIMGDKLSEVGTSTKNIFLESACFESVIVRRGSRKLGLSSESSYRFERQVDFERVKQAQDRAVKLICDIAGAKFVDEKEVGLKFKPKVQQIKFDCTKANNLLSLNIGKQEIIKIFSSLGFSCKKLAKDTLLVNIPAFRRDIKLGVDLVEELSRIHGYHNIPSTIPPIRSAKIENPEQEAIKSSLRNILCALGFNEVINYSLVSKDVLDSACVNRDAVKLANPLSSEQEYLRPMFLSGLLNSLAYNLNRKNTDLKLFELGHIFGSDYSETISLGLIATGKFLDNWQLKKEFDFFSLKGDVDNLLERFGFGLPQFLLSQDNDMFSQGEAAKIICQDKEVGILGRIDNKVLLNFSIKNPPIVFYAEILLEELFKCARRRIRFQPLPVFPLIIRDLSLIAKKSICYEEIVNAINEEAGRFLKNIKLTDVYKGKQIPSGFIGLTLSLEFGLVDRTLTDQEVAEIIQRIIKRLKTEFAVEIR